MIRFLIPLLLLLCWAAPAVARPLVQLSVIDREGGGQLQPTWHDGQRWIAGTPGHRYAVRLTNTSNERVLVVLSIDGVNAVSGETADPSQAGYVLAPWQSTQVEGWRKSLDDVAAFVFTDLGDSYAARTGRPENVGVIGIAVFDEARRTSVYPPAYPPAPIARGAEEEGQRARKAAAPAAADRAMAEASAQAIGTGHGEREWSPVSRTHFTRASSRPTQLTEWRYDDHAALVARGVLPRSPRWHRHERPRAFPVGFVPDPL